MLQLVKIYAFHQDILRENLLKFNDVIVFRYTIFIFYKAFILYHVCMGEKSVECLGLKLHCVLSYSTVLSIC